MSLEDFADPASAELSDFDAKPDSSGDHTDFKLVHGQLTTFSDNV